jgi:hypothetical protein
VSTKSKRLERRIAELGEANDHLRAVLIRHKNAMVLNAKRIESGEWTDAAANAGVPGIRSEVTEAMDNFEKARHQVRLAFFDLGTDQGKSIAEMGRALGISRQLASRLAAEAKQASH